MNKESFEGNWNILKGKAKEKWGKLTDDDLMKINGKKEQLIGEIQKKYGYMKSQAEAEVANWEKSCGPSCGCSTDRNNQSGKSHEDQQSQYGNQNKIKQKH
jgi:uncharacterized protein YjbJ (UPF0337 family)